jgi:DnaJ-domain-containing protein 1
VDRSPLVVGLAAVFAGITVFLVVLAAAFRDVVVFAVALPFAAATYLFWQHAAGRIRERVETQARRARATSERRDRGGFGADARFGDARTRFGREARQAAGAGGNTAGGSGRSGGRDGRRVDPNAGPDISRTEAYATLGVDPDADDEAVRRAYRERVKETHPDRGGDEERFKQVTAAYERLTD